MSEQDIGSVSGTQLRLYIDRIEQIEQEKAEVQEQVKDALAEAKANGFDTKIMRQLIRIRKMKKEDLTAYEELLDLYRRALGE